MDVYTLTWRNHAAGGPQGVLHLPRLFLRELPEGFKVFEW
jgi:hypothetical protein